MNQIFRGKKVLVTGAGGFIGSHLAEALVRQGAEVSAMVRYNSRNSVGWLSDSPFRKEMNIEFGDIRDVSFVEKCVSSSEIVFHLAALIGIPYSYEAPESYVATNIQGTLNVLQAGRKNQSIRIVHTSTSEVYGTALTVPITEDHPLQGQSPYSATKIGADKIAESFYLSFNLPVTVVRPFNTYGPRQSKRAIIPTIISQALAGENISLGSLHPTRDLNYVDDTVAGFMAAAASTASIGKTVHLGTGSEISIGDLVQMILRQLNKSCTIKSEDVRIRPEKSEVERLLADPKKAKELLGWKSQIDLEEGIKRTIQWMKMRPEYLIDNKYTV